jgi:type VI secretion system secreted protein Hcp
MAVNAFLKLDGIEGESTDHKHKGEIELESFSFGASNSSTVGGKGGGEGKVSLEDFSFTAKVGPQSSQLFQHLLDSRRIQSGTLTVNNGKEVETIVMLGDVLVSGYKESLDVTVACDRDRDDQKNNVPMESVSLNFAKIEFKSS